MSAIAAKYAEKYRSLIDEETWNFIERIESFYPPDFSNQPLQIQRALYDKLCREFVHEFPEDVRVTEFLASDADTVVQSKLYQQTEEESSTVAEAVVLYLHGGGFLYGGLDSHEIMCADICSSTHLTVMAIEYRLSPEHLHPAAFEDALIAYHWAHSHYERPIILCGDGTGANLAAAVSHKIRGEEQQPIGQVLIYPALGGNTTTGSYIEHAQAPLMSLEDIHHYQSVRLEKPSTEPDPTMAPLLDTDFSGLPPTVSFGAELDPAYDDSRLYVDAIIEAGGDAKHIKEPGLVHGYLRARNTVTRVRESFERIIEALDSIATGKWPQPTPFDKTKKGDETNKGEAADSQDSVSTQQN